MTRLQYVTGQVSVQPGGTGDWAEASADQSLGNGDNIWADKNSRAELNVGTGLMRIDSETSLTTTDVNGVRVYLHQGSLNVRARRLGGGSVEVDTPNLAFTVRQPGDYRFDVPQSGNSIVVTVRKGQVDLSGPGPGVSIHAGEQMQFTGSNSQEHQVQDAPRPDAFDDWCALRDQVEGQSGPNRGPGGEESAGPPPAPPGMSRPAGNQVPGVSAGGKWQKFDTRSPMTNASQIRFQLQADNPLRDSRSNPEVNIYCANGHYTGAQFSPNVRINPTRPGFWGQPQVQVVVRADDHHDLPKWNWNGRFLDMDKDTVRRLIAATVFKVQLPGPEGYIAGFSPAGLGLDQFESACHLDPKK